MSEFLYEVGDEFEGSPILGGRFLSEVLAVGGLVEVDGSIIRIIYLPASVHGKEEVIEKYKDPEPELDPVVAIPEVLSPVEEVELGNEPEPDLSPAEYLADIEEVFPDEVVVPAPKPVETDEDGNPVQEPKKPARRGRPKKVVEEE